MAHTRTHTEAIAALVASPLVAGLTPRQRIDRTAVGRSGFASSSEVEWWQSLSEGERALLAIAADVEQIVERLPKLDAETTLKVVDLAAAALVAALAVAAPEAVA